jgi:hypothetical protein
MQVSGDQEDLTDEPGEGAGIELSEVVVLAAAHRPLQGVAQIHDAAAASVPRASFTPEPGKHYLRRRPSEEGLVIA